MRTIPAIIKMTSSAQSIPGQEEIEVGDQDKNFGEEGGKEEDNHKKEEKS